MEEVMLSVIAVNHNSSELLKECLSSIQTNQVAESLEFLVIDSGSREEEVARLSELKSDNVNIILSKENIGYAKAVNIGIRHAHGDFILITNPDVFYNPGSIRNMLTSLSELPRCGAAAPKTWWNKQMTFLLPFSESITPFMIFKKELMRFSRSVSESVLKGWLKETLVYWMSEKPVRIQMLSGACIMTTRKIIEHIGGFDETFPLYFEDTDWFLRVRKAGYDLYMAPDAHIIHYYSQSAGQDMESSQKKFDDSMEKYIRKHFRGQLSLYNQLKKLKNCGHKKAYMHYDEMGNFTASPAFTFEDSARKLLLLSPVETMIPSAGAFFEGTSFCIPEDLWDSLWQGRYFVKVFDLMHLKSCGAWSWRKE